jgi:hypothetical protein
VLHAQEVQLDQSENIGKNNMNISD